MSSVHALWTVSEGSEFEITSIQRENSVFQVYCSEIMYLLGVARDKINNLRLIKLVMFPIDGQEILGVLVLRFKPLATKTIYHIYSENLKGIFDGSKKRAPYP